MRLKVKNIGSELSLDEYNAYQYLLYNMNCWKETITFNTYIPYQGNYADYLLLENNSLLPEKNENFTVKNEFTSSNPSLILELSNENTLLDKKHIAYDVTLHIKKPTTIENINIEYTDENNQSSTVTGNLEQHAIDNPEINQSLQEEAHARPNVQTDYETITIPSTYNPDTHKLQIPLYKENTSLLPVGAIISKEVDLQLNLNTKPYIDINNGRPNEINEILLDNSEELFSLIHFIPSDRTKTIIRLDSNTPIYTLKNTLIIKNGQNIEIHGGTNTNAIIDGSIVKRSIIIKPGGQLSLKNLTLQNNSCNQSGVYDKGKGGAILVESQTQKGNTTFGVLECDNCTFQDNNAGTGGAIYSYHGGVYINNCEFNNNSANNGGAIYYYSQDIIMTMADIYAKAGDTITVKCYVKNYLGRNISSGNVIFYSTLDKNEEYKCNIVSGLAQLQYNIPLDIKDKQFNITAVYQGSSTTDSEVAKNTIYIKTKEKYTLVIENPPETIYAGDWLILTASATNLNKQITNLPNAIFTYNNTALNYTRINNKYQIKKQVPTGTTGNLTIKFTLEENDEYETSPKTVSKTIKVLEKPVSASEAQSAEQNNGYITGLVITNAKNKTTSNIDTWINTEITDLYVYYPNVTILNCENIKLSKNSNGTNVKKLQTILKSLGYSITVDGDFGKQTKSVVTKFQKDNPPLADDGVVGPETCKVLNKKSASTLYDFISKTENKKVNVHIVFDIDKDFSKVSTIKTQIDELIKYKIKGFCFHNLRYDGTSDKVKNQMKWNTSENTKVTKVKDTIKTLHDYIKSKGGYITSMTVMPDESYNAPAYGQDYLEISKNVDYIIPLTYEPQWNQNSTWVERVIKYINTKTNNTNILPQLITYTNDNNPTSTMRSKTELTNTLNVIVKQDKVKGYILFKEGAINDYPSSYAKLMEAK